MRFLLTFDAAINGLKLSEDLGFCDVCLGGNAEDRPNMRKTREPLVCATV